MKVLSATLLFLAAAYAQDDFGCDICAGEEVTKPDNIVPGQGFGPDITCAESVINSVNIPSAVCDLVQSTTIPICCGDGTAPPTVLFTLEPSSMPSPVPGDEETPAPTADEGSSFTYPAECELNENLANGEFAPCLICPEGQISDDDATNVTVATTSLSCQVWSFAGLCGQIPDNGSTCSFIQNAASDCSCVPIPPPMDMPMGMPMMMPTDAPVEMPMDMPADDSSEAPSAGPEDTGSSSAIVSVGFSAILVAMSALALIQ